MKIRFLLLIACLALAGTGAARAQTSVADEEAVRQLYDRLFEALRQAGAQGVVAYLRQSGAIEEEVLGALERRAGALERDPRIGRPDSYVIVNETELPRAPRYRTVYALTHHDSRPVAWRLRFYKKVTGVWVFTDVQWEERFVEDFLRLGELEFLAYKRMREPPPAERREPR